MKWFAFTLMLSTSCRQIAVVFAALMPIATITGCDSHPGNPKLEWGWVTNCTGSVFRNSGPPGRSTERPVFRINDQLVVAVPKENRPYARSIRAEPRECRKIDDLPKTNFLGFVIWGNWSAGYKPEEIPSIDGMDAKHVRPDLVSVRIDREGPSTLSPEEQQKVDRMVQENLRELYAGGRQIAGLTCGAPGPGEKFYCFGKRSPTDNDVTRLDYTRVYAPVLALNGTQIYKSSFVHMHADYVSSRYGGIHVYWQTVTSDIAHWRDIDAAVFDLLSDWNLLNNKKAQREQR